jgi:hypothetical protein
MSLIDDEPLKTRSSFTTKKPSPVAVAPKSVSKVEVKKPAEKAKKEKREKKAFSETGVGKEVAAAGGFFGVFDRALSLKDSFSRKPRPMIDNESHLSTGGEKDLDSDTILGLPKAAFAAVVLVVLFTATFLYVKYTRK